MKVRNKKLKRRKEVREYYLNLTKITHRMRALRISLKN